MWVMGTPIATNSDETTHHFGKLRLETIAPNATNIKIVVC